MFFRVPTALFMLLLIPSLVGCGESTPHPIEKILGSFSDSLPNISLPEEADPGHENWAGIDLEPKAPVMPLYPEEASRTFLLPEGYEITPILTEPEIEQPGAIAFDGNGRMYVLELRTYMLTADSDGELDPVSRISRWEDTDNDGVYETGTVFVDSLVFPRFVLPYGKDCILAMESNQDNVYRYTDTDGDGKADQKTLFTNRYGRSGNVEHQQAFLYWGMDNWLYSTVNAFRIRETPTGVVREATGFNHAQWGITHDDDGKLWFLGGASGLPSYFQFPIHYGNFEVPGSYAEGFEVPWGAPVGLADMQGGMDQVRQPDGSLNRVTGAAGNDIYRGDRLPKELYGQLFYGEPVARIVRQVNPEVNEGLTTLHNVYQSEHSEFLKSTDPLFRPVDLTTAPDGTLYLTDMYHGIIQEGEWVKQGSYLRTKIDQYQLDKVIGLGRIWRITHKDYKRDNTQPKMLNMQPSALVQYLEHPNGWWRDKAQQLIVLSGDLSVKAPLEKMAVSGSNLLGRFHALWSLEGLGVLKPYMVKKLAQDPNPRMRIQALRAGETLYKGAAKQLNTTYLRALEDPESEVVMQALLSARLLDINDLEIEVKKVLSRNSGKGVQLVGTQILNKRIEDQKSKGTKLSEEQLASLERGNTIFQELCVQCHGPSGTGVATGNGQLLAPALNGSMRIQAHPEYSIQTVMNGLKGPIDSKSYSGGVMIGNREQSDEWIADVVSYIRRNLSNEASLVTAQQVRKVRNDTQKGEYPYTYESLLKKVPQKLEPSDGWKITASHSGTVVVGGTADPKAAFNFEGWTTGVWQEKGMWYQIDFTNPIALSEIHFNAPNNGTVWEAAKKPAAYPRGLVLESSLDGISWKKLEIEEPNDIRVALKFPETRLEFLRFTLTDVPLEMDNIPWSMRQMELYGHKLTTLTKPTQTTR
jgi:mono/diheme cytochrome c family protein/glucose/arabinose dehydrogenase